MTTIPQLAPSPELTPESDSTHRPHALAAYPVTRWHPATLAAFRFAFVYLTLYVVSTQVLSGMLPVPGVNVPSLENHPPVTSVVVWIARHVLGITKPIPVDPTGSGDKLFNFAHAISLLLISAGAAAVWSAVTRRAEHDRLYGWFRLFIRMALATTMLTYGFAKLIPLQMPTLALTRLVEPFGNFSPMGVLWYSIGAAPAYEVFVGTAEVAAGLLLFLPRTTTLGAMMCLMDSIAIFTLNMTYDVPVKLFSFHLILISIFLMAPNARRLFDLFVRHRRVELWTEPPLGSTSSARRKWVVAQVVFGLCVVLNGLYGSVTAWKQFGGGSPKSVLFGIWEVERMTIDGELHPALLTDSTRWQRLIFQSPARAAFQRMNDTFTGYPSAIDTAAHTITLTMADSTKPKSVLTYQRPTHERLIVDGALEGRALHMELAYRDPDSFLVRSRGFHWVQEVPFNR